MQMTTQTQTTKTGVTIVLDMAEARDVLSALERGVPNMGNFRLIESLRDTFGMMPYTAMAAEAIGEGHYDNDIYAGSLIKAIKRLRITLSMIPLKVAKDLMVERRDLLRDADTEIRNLHRSRCGFAEWECELLGHVSSKFGA